MVEAVKPKTTPKDFFLWLGAMVALYVSAVSLILLSHTYIEVWFPDLAVVYGDPYSGPIRFAIASLVVMFPLFIWFLRMLHQDIQKTPEKKEIWVRRWLVMLTLFIAGLAMAIDVIILINTYLQGDVTTRFALKALSVLVILLGVFWYFLEELRGTWERKVALSTGIGIGVSLIVAVAVVASFFIIGSPETARHMRYDDQKVADLQNIQWQLVNFWQLKQTLPESLEELKDPIGGYTVPVDTQTGESYRYERTSNSSFKICAIFNAPSRETMRTDSSPMRPLPAIDPSNENWIHGVGETCFDRTVDPERYPPFKK
ncbi:hypothetical protein K2X83_02635 [Patescibacteria group bacterium]|nr:hypothetical protein [Patescibacteria group bacterium]